MTAGNPLAKPHLLSHYRNAAKQPPGFNSDHNVEGVVYVETDVRYETPNGDVASWAKGPLDEIRFLRRAVEGHYDGLDGKMLLGLVPWAPMDQPTAVLEQYLRLAEEAAGPETWRRVKGFRFLLQFIHDQAKFQDLALGDTFIANLQLLGQRGFSFDIGVDQRSGGTWQLSTVAKTISLAHHAVPEPEQTTFILNHLCKPSFAPDESTFLPWRDAITALSQHRKTYMKLSGAFSELPAGLGEPFDAALHMQPWVRHVMGAFGPERVMFGSDWPVCNVAGPMGEESWVSWKEVVEVVLGDPVYGLEEAERERVWRGTAREAYRLDW